MHRTLTFCFVITSLLISACDSSTVNKNTAQHCEFKPEMVHIPGGTFTMGAGGVHPEEGPQHKRKISDFYISKYEVTNAEFAEFVEATEYVTVAEREPKASDYPDIDPSLLKAGAAVFTVPDSDTPSRYLNWWTFVEGAHWRQPEGPGSSIADKAHHPVVHIALEDAQAYAAWKGQRLPTEAEYEFAARGGIEGARYERGDTLTPGGKHQANTWQGLFPFSNSADDGHEGLAPVGCYQANGYGLHDMIGNVWEWTETAYFPSHHPDAAKRYQSSSTGYGFDRLQPGVPVGVIKGGSYLCAKGFCTRYRPAARHAQDTGLGTSHIGFRTVSDTNPQQAAVSR